MMPRFTPRQWRVLGALAAAFVALSLAGVLTSTTAFTLAGVVVWVVTAATLLWFVLAGRRR